jgi:phosphate/phosphite/phosphonate ABC transporter binding protein
MHLLAFGYAARAPSTVSRERMAQFSTIVGSHAGVEVAVCEARTYEDLAVLMAKGEVDFAWLPPIPFIALERRGAAVPIASNVRGGKSQFHSVLIVHAKSRIKTPLELKGKRAVWVDPYSASGYVLPRIALSAIGVDVRRAFAEESFLHSHEAVVSAVVSKSADFGGTYAGIDETGGAVRGVWLEMQGAEESVRVLASFGAIPGDLIAARPGLAASVREKLTFALIKVSRDKKNELLIREVFGVDEFRRFMDAGYDVLRRATNDASASGILNTDDARLSRPD